MTSDELEERLAQDSRFQALEGPARVEKRKLIYDKLGITLPESQTQKPTYQLGPVNTYVRPALEALGMGGGALVGTPAGPYGAAGGAILGYTGGSTLASLLERVAGERAPIQSLGEVGSELASGLKEGAIAEAGGQVLKRVVPFVLSPFAKQYEQTGKAVNELAKERGIKLDPHEILQSRPLALGHKVLENVPFTSGMVQRKELEKLAQLASEWQKVRDKVGAPDRQRLAEIGTKIQDAVEGQLKKVGVHQAGVREKMSEDLLRLAGSPVTYKELGTQTQNAITTLHQAKKGIESLGWEHARSLIPESDRVVNTHLKDTAQKILKDYELAPSMLDEPLTRQLGDMMKSGNPKYDELVKSIPDGLPQKVRDQILKEVTKGEQPGWPVQALLKLRSALSDKAAAHHTGIQQGGIERGSQDAYGKIYTDLKKAIDRQIEEYGAKSGSEIAEALKAARQLSADRLSFMNPKDNPYIMKTLKAEAETLDRVLIKPGNAAGFTELKQSLGHAGVQPIKQAFTNRLLGVGGKEQEALHTLRTTLDRYGKQTLAEVYSPQELTHLYNLADKSKWMKQSPVGNPFFRELVKSNPSQVAPAILSDSTTTAKTLRTFPEMRGHLRQAFVDGLHPKENTPFPTRLLEMINSYPKEVQRQLFSPNELKDFHQLARIIERTKGTVKLAENPSGTAQNLVTFTTAGAILKHPISNAPQVISTAALTKLYLSETGRKLLMEGLVNPIRSAKAAEAFAKLTTILAADERDRITQKQKSPSKRTPIQWDDEP